MSLNDPLASMFSQVLNCEKIGKNGKILNDIFKIRKN